MDRSLRQQAESGYIWTAGEIADDVGGRLLSGNGSQEFSGISIDSRTIRPLDCFVAVKGDVHDGHTFVPDVLARGVNGVVIQQGQVDGLRTNLRREPPVVCIEVADTLTALGALAGRLRRRSGISVAAITGSNGKTSTRAMAAAVLGRQFRVLNPEGNFNNEVGLPLTLLRLHPSHRWAVLELGMNHAGEIRRLANICRPDIGLITNIGPAHLEGLGSIEGVMHAKGELLEKIGPDGTVILNADDPMTAQLAAKTPLKPLLFGLSSNADVRGSDIAADSNGISFRLHLQGRSRRVSLKTPGRFMTLNALAAAAVGHAAGLSAGDIADALSGFSPVKGRLNLHRIGRNGRLIDDTYNANPASVRAALATLAEMRKNHRALAVLGDMLELGDASWELHREVGSAAARSGLSRLYVTGNFAPAVAQGARDAGMADEDIFVGSKEEILMDLKKQLRPEDRLLIKGSRGMRMETLVQEIMKEQDEAAS